MKEKSPWPWAQPRRREPWSTKPKWKQILDEPGAREKLKIKNNPPQEMYGRWCRRCEEKYYTKHKKSKYCDKCKLPQGLGYILKNEEPCQKKQVVENQTSQPEAQ